MADNDTLPATGDVIRSKDHSGVKTQLMGLDLNPNGSEQLMAGVMPSGGDVAHGATNSGNPLQLGTEAIAHGTNPTAVAAAQRTKLYANRAGVPFVIGGHPNVVTIRLNYTTSQTDVAIATVATGLKIVVTRISVASDNATSVAPAIRVGFGTTNTPTTTGTVFSHPGFPAGGHVTVGDGTGILGVGADNEDLRVTGAAPSSGSIDLVVSYYTVES